MTRRNRRDPYWITCRFDGKCTCGEPIKRGRQAFYYPATKTMLGRDCGCGQAAAADFEAACADEDFYNSGA